MNAAITGSVNMRRSPIVGSKTGVDVCSRGHAFSEENTRISKRADRISNRNCRECRRIWRAARRASP